MAGEVNLSTAVHAARWTQGGRRWGAPPSPLARRGVPGMPGRGLPSAPDPAGRCRQSSGPVRAPAVSEGWFPRPRQGHSFVQHRIKQSSVNN